MERHGLIRADDGPCESDRLLAGMAVRAERSKCDLLGMDRFEQQRHRMDEDPHTRRSEDVGGQQRLEADRLSAAHAAILREGFTDETQEELFRAAHDIKGDAATFGFPSAGAAAESLCRIIEHAPDLDRVPSDLIGHHINAIQAIVRERTKLDNAATAGVLSRSLRGIADEFLTHANRDRPEHLEAILAPSIIPSE